MVDVPKIPSDHTGCEASEPFALRVLGDSMSPEFPDGSIIIVDPSDSAQDGDYVIVATEGTFIFRQLRMEGNRMLIRALNPGYPDMDISGTKNNIKGVVTQRAGTRRKHRKHYF